MRVALGGRAYVYQGVVVELAADGDDLHAGVVVQGDGDGRIVRETGE